MKKNYKSIILITTLVLLDQIIKFFIETKLDIGNDINNSMLFSITKIHNYGISFSLLEGRLFLIVIVTFAALIYLYNLKKDFNNKFTLYGIDLIIAGGIGNLIDRIVHGYVIDYIKLNFINFPIFNLADILVSFGFILILISLILKKK